MSAAGELPGRVALVTGGARGIGRAIVACLQREGVSVALLDCDQPAGEVASFEMSRAVPTAPVQFIHADMGAADGFERVRAFMHDSYGRIDLLFHNAGLEIEQTLEETRVADWDRVLAVNLRGALLLTQALLPLFPAAGGAIVNISSIHARRAFPASLAYACSKAGLLALTRNLALELAERRIRVNAVSPGYIDTRMWDEYLQHVADPQAVAERTAALHPLGRRGMAEDVARAAVYLASDAASFVTGTELVVDGGLTIRAHP
jgi:2-keto-3-deoxy-L-fuconate dehydrogenase